MNLAAAGITPGKRGLISVDHRYRTTVQHIYAAGDVIGPPALAATGMEQARWAVTHAFGITAKADIASLQPTGIYTIPEASMVGETEAGAQSERNSVIWSDARVTAIRRAATSSATSAAF